MKSRSNKAEKRMIETKTVMKIQLNENGLWPVFTETKLQIEGKMAEKRQRSKKQMLLKSSSSKSHNRHKISNKRIN